MSVKKTFYGATLYRLYVKYKYGKADDILIGFDTLDDHENFPSCVFDSGEEFKTISVFKFGIKE